MSQIDLGTKANNTWCPGCGNFAILNAIKSVLKELVEEGTPLENIVLLSGIGCHAKIVDYINVNSFYSVHGRVLPPAQAIKIAHPDLKVIGFAGDGDAYVGLCQIADGIRHGKSNFFRDGAITRKQCLGDAEHTHLRFVRISNDAHRKIA